MLIDHSREKLINAIVYFAQKTKYCGKTKLFKLLYLLDFEHFRQTGRSVTGLNYYAWDKGPVPTSLYYEMKSPKKDLAEKVTIESKETKHENPIQLTSAKTNFDSTHFSKRELHILESLSKQFRYITADKIAERTHLVNEPWHKVFQDGKGRDNEIPYEYALSEDEKEFIQYMVSEHKEMLNNYK